MELTFNIFISHDSRDEAIAVELKSFLENIFLNSTVYVSGRDLQGGQTWIENIKKSLKSSQVIISIITKNSIQNNWIYFETGAGFTDDKSIPLLADDLKFSDLNPPLSLLQARTITKSGIEDLINDISSKLTLRRPKILSGLENLIDASKSFFDLRNKENQKVTITKKTTPVMDKSNSIVANNSQNNVDESIVESYNLAKNRALKLTIAKIHQYKGTFELPTDDELNNMDLGQIQNIAIPYGIPYPSNAFLDLLLISFPKADAKQWEKMNALKRLEDANQNLDKYQKQHGLIDSDSTKQTTYYNKVLILAP